MTRLFANLTPATSGAVLMVSAGALFALVNTLVQHGTMNLGIPPARIAFWQYLIALAFAVPWVLSTGISAMQTSRWPQHLLRVAMAAGGVQLWVMGLAHVPIWQAIALIMLSPFFVTLGAALLLREAATLDRWFAVAAGFAGGMIILAPWSESFSLYALYPVGAAALWAGASLMTKLMTRTEAPETLTVYLLLLLTPINALVAVPDGLTLEGGSVALLLAAGLMTGVAQYFLAKAYSLADAAYLQPFDHVKLPFNVGLGLLAFGFVPPGSMWIGSALIVGASAFLLQREGRSAVA
ncbi:DMT family transporter [Halovulum sp. GXIMD14793]